MISQFKGAFDFLSNFHPSPIFGQDDEILYPTVEHYFQARKTMDMNRRALVAKSATPAVAKRAGRSLLLRQDWERVKIPVMRDALSLKFSHGSQLAERLLNTGSHVLVEGNTWGDAFWGVDTRSSSGENWLGHLLMARRAELVGD